MGMMFGIVLESIFCASLTVEWAGGKDGVGLEPSSPSLELGAMGDSIPI
jgi:hypothetical protein